MGSVTRNCSSCGGTGQTNYRTGDFGPLWDPCGSCGGTGQTHEWVPDPTPRRDGAIGQTDENPSRTGQTDAFESLLAIVTTGAVAWAAYRLKLELPVYVWIGGIILTLLVARFFFAWATRVTRIALALFYAAGIGLFFLMLFIALGEMGFFDDKPEVSQPVATEPRPPSAPPVLPPPVHLNGSGAPRPG